MSSSALGPSTVVASVLLGIQPLSSQLHSHPETPPESAHTSSTNNLNYHAILKSSLELVDIGEVEKFLRYVRQMPHRFHTDDMRLQHLQNLYGLRSEADISNLVENQVLFPAWLVVCQMVPLQRNYNMLVYKQLSVTQGIPDHSFCRDFSDTQTEVTSEEFTLVEFKGAGQVRGLFRDLALRTVPHDESSDWIEITQQLRKYAVNSSAKDIIVMDQSAAIYFRFSDSNPSNEYEKVEFLVADLTLAHRVAEVPLTLRELVAFVCWRGLLKKAVQLQDFASGAVNYRPVSLNTDTPQNRPGNRLQEQQNQWRQRPTRGSARGSDMGFTGFTEGSSFRLVFTPLTDEPADDQHPAQLRIRGQSPSTDSGYGGSSPNHGDRRRRRFMMPLDGDKYQVRTVFTERLALLSSGHGSWIAKLFYDDDDMLQRLNNEVRVYNLCRRLQGCEISYVYALATIAGISGTILLMEHITPGTTISNIRQSALAGDIDSLHRLESLAPCAWSAVEALHRHGVVHNDLRGRNMLVSRENGQEFIVIVDFDCSMVFSDGSGRKQWEDRAILRGALKIPGEEQGVPWSWTELSQTSMLPAS